ncbi:hypothetical protein Ancab_025845 [Ancistrocladus abbreviatus]
MSNVLHEKDCTERQICALIIADKIYQGWYECAGIVEEVGNEMESLVAADRVALEPASAAGAATIAKMAATVCALVR